MPSMVPSPPTTTTGEVAVAAQFVGREGVEAGDAGGSARSVVSKTPRAPWRPGNGRSLQHRRMPWAWYLPTIAACEARRHAAALHHRGPTARAGRCRAYNENHAGRPRQDAAEDLVERYIADGQPVGSRTLSRAAGSTCRRHHPQRDGRPGGTGLIASPHTSAGRVPTRAATGCSSTPC